MKQYKIFKHSSGKIEAVKQGWSWPAFVFNWIWVIVKKQWLLGFGIIFLWGSFNVSLSILSEAASNSSLFKLFGGLFSSTVSYILGSKGNALRESHLISRKYEYIETIEAKNPDSAVAAYVKSLTG